MSESRYHRQQILPQIGAAGQQRLADASVLIVGCGALGCHLADQLVRAGIGHLRIVDRDLVDWTNLQRQTLYTEEDARNARPKALAAAERLRAINSAISIEPVIADVDALNLPDLLGVGRDDQRKVDLILDGTDNVSIRYLLNDAAVRYGIPWVYGACVGTEGRAMGVIPGRTPCLRCLFPVPPAGHELPTCDMAGVLGSAAAVAASWEVAQGMKILVEGAERFAASLFIVDMWNGRARNMELADGPDPGCPCCGKRAFEFLSSTTGRTATLCGRDAVQLYVATGRSVDLAAMADRLRMAGRVEATPWFTRCHLADPAGVSITLFRDGRAIVSGVREPAQARALCARFIGI